MLYAQGKINADCIIPAAGLSSRMGQWKLTLPFNTSTIVEESIKNALPVCSRVILVVGHRADELIEKVSGYPDLDIVINDNYQNGMYSSISKGVESVESSYFFISHADMPCIHREIYLNLWKHRTEGSVFPGSEKRTGHPVLISSRLKPVIIDEQHHHSMKEVLTRFPTKFLNLNNPEIYLDIDTPDAYEMLLSQQNRLSS